MENWTWTGGFIDFTYPRGPSLLLLPLSPTNVYVLGGTLFSPFSPPLPHLDPQLFSSFPNSSFTRQAKIKIKKMGREEEERCVDLTPAVQINRLSFTYPGIDGHPPPGSPPLIHDFSLSLNSGDRCLLVGSNGAGNYPRLPRPDLNSYPAFLLFLIYS